MPGVLVRDGKVRLHEGGVATPDCPGCCGPTMACCAAGYGYSVPGLSATTTVPASATSAHTETWNTTSGQFTNQGSFSGPVTYGGVGAIWCEGLAGGNYTATGPLPNQNVGFRMTFYITQAGLGGWLRVPNPGGPVMRITLGRFTLAIGANGMQWQCNNTEMLTAPLLTDANPSASAFGASASASVSSPTLNGFSATYNFANPSANPQAKQIDTSVAFIAQVLPCSGSSTAAAPTCSDCDPSELTPA